MVLHEAATLLWVRHVRSRLARGVVSVIRETGLPVSGAATAEDAL